MGAFQQTSPINRQATNAPRRLSHTASATAKPQTLAIQHADDDDRDYGIRNSLRH